ncbi:MAG: TldD/PmbA family protein [Bacteroidales bacterium]|nr:TldD/PmbA family protein [Bacteroidales bacterium]
MINQKEYYLDTFRVTEPMLESLISSALRSGGDYADLYFENTVYSDLLLRDGQVASGGLHTDFGVGIRVLKGDKTGYAYTESTDPAEMMQAAKAAATISLQGGVGAAKAEASVGRHGGKPNPAADRYPMEQDWRQASASAFVPMLEKLQGLIESKDSRVIKVIAMLGSQVSDILMFNSLGELKYDTRPMGSLSVSVIFKQGEVVENKSASRSWRIGAEMMDDALLEELAAEVVSGIDQRFQAIRPKGGKMSVVMGAGASGILLHEAMGHAFEADFNRKGQSVFSDKMGKRICDKGITIVDDGTIRCNRGSINFDDELVAGQRTVMVEDGVLTSYLHDRISAKFYGVPHTGNGRRESFRYHPIQRMRCTYMESGQAKSQDIIASVKKGVFVDQFSNGQVKIGEGDFTFYVKSGFLIEDGRLTAPIKDINIIGNGPAALADMRMVADDLIIDPGTWTCGKEQSVPVSCGIPTVLVENLTVGGE